MGFDQQLKWLLIPGSQLKGSVLELAVPAVVTIPEGTRAGARFCCAS